MCVAKSLKEWKNSEKMCKKQEFNLGVRPAEGDLLFSNVTSINAGSLLTFTRSV